MAQEHQTSGNFATTEQQGAVLGRIVSHETASTPNQSRHANQAVETPKHTLESNSLHSSERSELEVLETETAGSCSPLRIHTTVSDEVATPSADDNDSSEDEPEDEDMELERLSFTKDKAHHAMKNSDWPKAEQSIREILKMKKSYNIAKDVDDAVWLIRLSEVQVKQTLWTDALATALSIPSNNKDGIPEHLQASIYHSLGRMKQAKRSCKKAVSIRRRNPDPPGHSSESYRDSVRLMVQILTQLEETAELEFYESLLQVTPAAISSHLAEEPASPTAKEIEQPSKAAKELGNATKSTKLFKHSINPDPEVLLSLHKLALDFNLALDSSGTITGSSKDITGAVLYAIREEDRGLAKIIFKDMRVRELTIVYKGGYPSLMYTPIRIAAYEGKYEIVRILLDLGIVCDRSSGLPLVEVCMGCNKHPSSRRVEIMELLIRQGFDLCKFYGADALLQAVRHDSEELVRALRLAGVRIDSLKSLSSAGSDEMVKLLLGFGASMNRGYSGGKTALHHAVIASNENQVRIFLSNGANKNTKDMRFRKPIDYCTDPKIRKLLETS